MAPLAWIHVQKLKVENGVIYGAFKQRAVSVVRSQGQFYSRLHFIGRKLIRISTEERTSFQIYPFIFVFPLVVNAL